MIRRLTASALAGACALATVGCGGDAVTGSVPASTGATTAPVTSPAPGGSSSAVGSATSGTTSSTAGSPAPTGSTAPSGSCSALAASLPLEQQVGQLYMMGLDGASLTAAEGDTIHRLGIGSVLVLTNPPRGVAATAALAQQVQDAAADPTLPVLVSTDQEGGKIQRLKGEGFSNIPPATTQATWSTSRLQQSWQTWAAELARAGVHYDLAPDADLVRPADVSRNAPVGMLHRNYGTSVEQVARADAAAVAGMRRAGVVASVKHFPGLGAVTTNTDFGAASDTTTSATSPSVQVFARAISTGVGSVMISSAVFRRIDANNPGVFSPQVITHLLRERLGYRGVVISDDLGAAAAVGNVPSAERGTRFLLAGGDLVIDASPDTVADMVANTLARARSDASFAGAVTASAARVLALKAEAGQVSCTA